MILYIVFFGVRVLASSIAAKIRAGATTTEAKATSFDTRVALSWLDLCQKCQLRSIEQNHYQGDSQSLQSHYDISGTRAPVSAAARHYTTRARRNDNTPPLCRRWHPGGVGAVPFRMTPWLAVETAGGGVTATATGAGFVVEQRQRQ